MSAQKAGILPISQQSTFVLASLAYHGYEGVAFRDEEKPRLQADLGEANFLMLRNHGLLVVGSTVAEAFLSMYNFENACRIQLDAQAGGELVQALHQAVAQFVARHALAGDADHAEFFRQQMIGREIVEGRDHQPVREIAGDAEDHQAAPGQVRVPEMRKSPHETVAGSQ